jgi:hypothetical protein
MNPTTHSTNNMLLGAPKDMENCIDVAATMMVEDSSTIITTFWTPTPEEIKAINSGAKVALYVWGTFHPPVAIGICESE